ncbi:alpha/beta hydrolase [Solwaraspora sp. WMMD792]|uniref:alpha/beta fold hydrolase n=1 Tax=Solwaraspora sp. WMMD792 TaxID=3016099 RepID=UPI0024181126|nr:alpha/beta hydrolase [Solwaraspora sp. WMMD792]MDG4769950.1 alpha/beta hydrolase [Solwaraspora sp. WMMD792]
MFRFLRSWRLSRLALAAVVLLGVSGAAAGSAPAAVSGAAALAGGPHGPKPTVVLVHGAFADASGWTDVARNLHRKGYPVIAPANPLRGVDSDAAYLRSVLDTIDGPIVLVGHSYGGFVMTTAATGDPDVKALVYIAAFAPDAGDTVGGLSGQFPGSRLDPTALDIRPYPGGADGYIKLSVFRSVFAADVPAGTAAIMAATQRPAELATLGQPAGAPAWATIPSWTLVAADDQVIPAAAQRFMAQRAGARVTEVTASHAVLVSRPGPTTTVILAAIKGVS